MWGVKECPAPPGSECGRRQLPLCDKPACYGNAELRKACGDGPDRKWHGHIHAAIKAEKKRERQVPEKKDFLAWQKAKQKENGVKGIRGAPNKAEPHSQGRPVPRGQGKRPQGQQNKQPAYPQWQKNFLAPARKFVSLGDFIPAPIPQTNAWAKQTAKFGVTPSVRSRGYTS